MNKMEEVEELLVRLGIGDVLNTTKPPFRYWRTPRPQIGRGKGGHVLAELLIFLEQYPLKFEDTVKMTTKIQEIKSEVELVTVISSVAPLEGEYIFKPSVLSVLGDSISAGSNTAIFYSGIRLTLEIPPFDTD